MANMLNIAANDNTWNEYCCHLQHFKATTERGGSLDLRRFTSKLDDKKATLKGHRWFPKLVAHKQTSSGGTTEDHEISLAEQWPSTLFCL